MKVHIFSSDERLVLAASGDRTDGLEDKIEWRKVTELWGQSFGHAVFKAD